MRRCVVCALEVNLGPNNPVTPHSKPIHEKKQLYKFPSLAGAAQCRPVPGCYMHSHTTTQYSHLEPHLAMDAGGNESLPGGREPYLVAVTSRSASRIRMDIL